MNESTEDLEELRRRLAQAEADRDASVRLLAATERALEVMADDYVRLAKSYGFVKGKPDERATYWMEYPVLSDPIAYAAIIAAEYPERAKEDK
ncbi:MAG: hypothetical protein EBR82_51530 [Caulobacteraceae bacterium]|nr:hypothetical protein [Caulobacteraceae bacterium]